MRLAVPDLYPRGIFTDGNIAVMIHFVDIIFVFAVAVIPYLRIEGRRFCHMVKSPRRGHTAMRAPVSAAQDGVWRTFKCMAFRTLPGYFFINILVDRIRQTFSAAECRSVPHIGYRPIFGRFVLVISVRKQYGVLCFLHFIRIAKIAFGDRGASGRHRIYGIRAHRRVLREE